MTNNNTILSSLSTGAQTIKQLGCAPKAIKDLLAEGLIVVAGEHKSGGRGRPSKLYALATATEVTAEAAETATAETVALSDAVQAEMDACWAELETERRETRLGAFDLAS